MTRAVSHLFAMLGLAFVLGSCPETSSPTDTVGTEDASADSSTPDVLADITYGVAGTQVAFELQGDFWDFPYPSDLRLTTAGGPDLTTLPDPLELDLFRDLAASATQRQGYPAVPVAWFRFDAPMPLWQPDDVHPASAESPFLLVSISPDADDRGRLYPVIAKTLEPDHHVPDNVIALAARPGFVLEPGQRYAFVVRRAAQDADGQPLGVPERLDRLRRGGASDADPDAVLYGPLWPVLDELGVSDVAAATVFTTGDVVADLFDLSERVRATYSRDIVDLALDPGDGATHERFCELHGSITLPQFQVGTPPFNDPTTGLFADETPTVQREEVAPVALTIPRSPMPPDGYPVVVYFHGSGGLSTQVVDRGPVTEPGGEQAVGRGPAHVLAAHGIATMGIAMPINPERVPGASGLTYITPSNLPAYRDTIRQGVLDARLGLDALLRLEVAASALQSCETVSTPVMFTTPMLMGQSQGAIYANMVAALDRRVGAVVPTGAGGLWSMQVLLNQEAPIAPLVALLLQTEAELTHLHPALHLMQTAWEPVETLVYMPRLSQNPLPDHPARHVYQPVGEGDTFYPTPVFDALALAFGHQQAGEEVWPEMQQALGLDGLSGFLSYPVSGNRMSRDGRSYTGVVVQYEGDGIANPHHIFVQLDAVKHQYGCFFQTYLEGTAVLPPPEALGTPCSAAP